MLDTNLTRYALVIGVSALVLPEAAGSIAFICAGMYGAEKFLK